MKAPFEVLFGLVILRTIVSLGLVYSRTIEYGFIVAL